jgi:hypothetical protein
MDLYDTGMGVFFVFWEFGMKNLETGFFVYGPLSCGKTLIALVKRELLSFTVSALQ